MNTEQRVLARLSKVKNIREAKKENLGAIEDAIKGEVKRLEDDAEYYIRQSNDIFDVIEDFWDMRDTLISKLQEATKIDMGAVDKLQQEMEQLSIDYNIELEGGLMYGLSSVESVVDASDTIIRGLEGIKTPGIG